jgi:hypothetical protein
MLYIGIFVTQLEVLLESLSHDGKRFAYWATEDGKSFVVLDGKEEKRYDGISRGGHPVFSPGGKHFGYVIFKEKNCFVVLDGKEGKEYDRIFTDIIFDSEDTFHYLALKDGGVYLVENRLR